jgi:TPR repeat protein
MNAQGFMKLKLTLILSLISSLALLSGRAAADETNAAPAYEKQVLKSILADADANKDNPELRKKYLNEFLARSSTMSGLLDETNVWIARAAAAIELDYPSEGWIAGKQLKRFGLQTSDNPAAMQVFADLDRKGWLGKDCPVRDWSKWTLDQAKAAANNGDIEAMNAMGFWYEEGWSGLSKDDTQAVNWYRKAAEQGNAFAQNSLGSMYCDGQGLEKNYAQAVNWYRKAAEQGNDVAQGNLGTMYVTGRGITQDYAQAVNWYLKAAEQGEARAQNNLGSMYQDGKGVAQDYTQAVDWFRKAAELGNAVAQKNLGVMYEKGKGVTQDYPQAVEWYRKAAEQGNANAQYILGMIYQNGQGVEKDLAQAKAWYQKAAVQGNEDAKKALSRLNQTSP